MATSTKQGKMSSRPTARELVDRLFHASRRPLFVEVTQTNINESTSVSEMLSKLDVTLLDDTEHGQVLRICCTMLLKFLLPHGNEYYLLQNSRQHASNELEMENLLIQMDLEEQLDRKVKYDSVNSFGSADDTLIDTDLDMAWTALLNALGRILSRRPFHSTQVDLLHLLAMILHPCPDPDFEGRSKNAFFEQKYRRLVRHPAAQQFHIHDSHREQVLELIRDHLVLPELPNQNAGSQTVGPLFFGAVPHLRDSLLSMRTSKAEGVWLKLSAQTQNYDMFLQNDFDDLLHRLVEGDHNNGVCYVCTHKKNQLCSFRERGKLLGKFIVDAGRTKKSIHTNFRHHTTMALAEAIECQLDSWIKRDGEEPDQRYPACLLASLLHSARSLLVFQPSSNSKEYDDDDPYDVLVQMAIHLLRHTDSGVCNAASEFLVQAYSYSDRNSLSKCHSLLVETVKMHFHTHKLEALVSVASSKSKIFAATILQSLLKKIKAGEENIGVLYRLVSSIALNCPVAAHEQLEALIEVLKSESGKESRVHLLYAIMSCRLALLVANKESDQIGMVCSQEMGSIENNWDRYRLARHAMVTGNFSVGAGLLTTILESELNEGHFLWLSVLETVSRAEASLVEKGGKGIPDAATLLQTAALRNQHLDGFHQHWKQQAEFQMRFVKLRLDFLDLITALRQLTKEMRLTGKSPGKTLRSVEHLRSVVRLFDALSARYQRFRQDHGLGLRHEQSLASISLLRDLSIFVALSARTIFADILSPKTATKLSDTSFTCDYRHPMASLMVRLDELINQPMDSSVEVVVRSAALLEIIERVLLVPIPFPRDFFAPQPLPSVDLFITSEPSQIIEEPADETLQSLATSPLLGLAICASGCIPSWYLNRCRNQVPMMKLWFRLKYIGPLEPDDEEVTPSIPQVPDLSSVSPWPASILSEGRFFVPVELPPFAEEGLFRLEVTAGYLDVDDNTWAVPIEKHFKCPIIRVARR